MVEFTIKFPSWTKSEKEEFLQTIKDSEDIEIKSRDLPADKMANNNRGLLGDSLDSENLLPPLRLVFDIAPFIYYWYQSRRKENKSVNPLIINNILINGDNNQVEINQKIEEGLRIINKSNNKGRSP